LTEKLLGNLFSPTVRAKALTPPSKREALGYTQKRELKKSPSGRGKIGEADRGRKRAAKPLLASCH
jgi:hypothetical protein